MRYPTIALGDCKGLADQRLGGHPGWEKAVERKTRWAGDGDDLDVARVERAAEKTRGLIPTGSIPTQKRRVDRDRVEGQAAVHIHEALQDIPVAVLDDRGFWRWLSLVHFWEFIAWREATPFDKGNHMKYLECENSSDAVLPRMYRRVAALGGVDYAFQAYALRGGTDFWRSHVLRVKTGTTPAMTRALVDFQARNQIKTAEIRELAKRIRRVWTNAVLEIYDDDEAKALIAEQAADFIELDKAPR